MGQVGWPRCERSEKVFESRQDMLLWLEQWSEDHNWGMPGLTTLVEYKKVDKQYFVRSIWDWQSNLVNQVQPTRGYKLALLDGLLWGD